MTMREIIIRTPYEATEEFVDAYSHRADTERLMLASPFPPDEREWVRFSVYLEGGSLALQGVGRVQQTLDNGDDVSPEERYDVVLETLAIDDDASREAFAALADLRAARTSHGTQVDDLPVGADETQIGIETGNLAAGNEVDPWREDPPTGEVSLDELSDYSRRARSGAPGPRSDAPGPRSDLPPAGRSAAPDPYPDETRIVVEGDSMRASAPPPPLPVFSSRSGFPTAAESLPPHSSPPARFSSAPPSALSRASRPPSWRPSVEELSAVTKVATVFAYAPDELPIPASPPHPELPVMRRVVRAPHPSRPSSRPTAFSDRPTRGDAFGLAQLAQEVVTIDE